MPEETPATPAPVDPKVGLTALLAKAPPWVMYALGALLSLAGAVEVTDQVAAGLLPVALLKAAHVVLAIGVFLGFASPGARKVAMVLLVLGLSSCTASQAFVVTGDSIRATGQQYVQTSAAMVKGVDEGKMTTAQFRAWVAFSDKFELVWDSAAAVWLRARETKQQLERGKVEAAIAGIAGELFGFYLKAKDANLLPAGTP